MSARWNVTDEESLRRRISSLKGKILGLDQFICSDEADRMIFDFPATAVPAADKGDPIQLYVRKEGSLFDVQGKNQKANYGKRFWIY